MKKAEVSELIPAGMREATASDGPLFEPLVGKRVILGNMVLQVTKAMGRGRVMMKFIGIAPDMEGGA